MKLARDWFGISPPTGGRSDSWNWNFIAPVSFTMRSRSAQTGFAATLVSAGALIEDVLTS